MVGNFFKTEGKFTFLGGKFWLDSQEMLHFCSPGHHSEGIVLFRVFFGSSEVIQWSSEVIQESTKLSFRMPYHFLHLLCMCMGRSLNVPIENLGYSGTQVYMT